MKCHLGIYLKMLEAARSQALIVQKDRGQTSRDEHQHKIDLHLG